MKTKRLLRCAALLVAVLCSQLLAVEASEVSVTVRDTLIPTYEVMDPDPNPIFYNGRRYQGAQGRVYPYALIHNLTNDRVDHSYREILLENEYVEISFLPELGGRIYYARDKRNGYDYLYHNEVVKPALIGMTGAWISGGVEWNIPHHHRATSFTPVDYTITEQADGSKTVWVGETEWRHRTRWVVGITLRPGSTLFETTIRVFNTTPVQNTLLVFANAAVHANEDYQVLFPPETQWTTYHRKNQFSQWPVSYQVFDGADYREGVDVSRWQNHSKPTSFFEWGNRGNFIAGIDHGANAGTVIFGDKHVNPGKKLWSWGNNPSGAMWDGLLTDENGPYIELMFGSYSDNQPDYSWLQAREVKEATYWFAPLNGLSDVKRVNENAVLAFENTSEGVRLGVNAHRAFTGARVRVSAGEEVLFEVERDLNPHEPFLEFLGDPGAHEFHDLTLSVLDASGATLITYSPVRLEEEPIPEPVSPLQDVDGIDDAEELYYQGLYYEQFHDAFYQPRDFYRRAIELNPQHVSALLRTGILYIKDGDYETAVQYLEPAVERVAWDYVTPERADALYYLAMAYEQLGRESEAYDLYYRAAWDYNFTSAAHFQMALMKAREGEEAAAMRHVENAGFTNARSVDVLGLKVTLLRRAGNEEDAERVARRLLEIDPLNFRGYHELYLITGDREVRGRLAELMRNSRENYLELAVAYAAGGFYSEAIALLEYGVELDDPSLSEYPIIHYHIGLYRHLQGDGAAAAAAFTHASNRPHAGVFPFRFETVTALETALSYDSRDGRAWYYLGNIYYDFQPERAIDAWERSVDLGSGIAVAHRNLAFAYANVKNDFDATLHHIRRALELNPHDPRYYYEQDAYLKTMRTSVEERLAPMAANAELMAADQNTRGVFAELLTLNGESERAIELMKAHQFRRWEGGGGVYPFWVYAHLNRGRAAMGADQPEAARSWFEAAISYPENLETVSSPLETIVVYHQAVLAERAGDREEAERLLRRAAGGSTRVPECAYFVARAHERLGETDRAEGVFRSLIQSGERELERETTVDFFDPFSRQRSGAERMAEGYFRLALGNHGLGESDRAAHYFSRAYEYDPALLSVVASYYRVP